MKIQPAASDLERILPPLRRFLQPLDDLVVDPNNAREHSESDIQAISDSLSEFGRRLPIIVQKRGMVVRAGNGRVLAARKLGWRFMSCLIVDENDVEAIRYSLADNRLSDLSKFDDAKLAQLLASLSISTSDLTIPGFDQSALQRIIIEFGGTASLLNTLEEEEDLPISNQTLVDYAEPSAGLSYCVIARLHSEQEQKNLFDELFDELNARGIACKVTLL